MHSDHAQHGHGHGHGHGHHDYSDEFMGDLLEQEGELHRGFTATATAWLADLLTIPVTRVLDAGSGPGLAACHFAEAFPEAEVVAVDAQEKLLARATKRAQDLGVATRFRTHVAELPHGVADLGPTDLVWSSNALHHVGDQQAAVTALAATLRPGGLFAIVEGGLPPRYLPRDIGLGTPGLQARMDAAAEDWFGTMRTDLPDSARTVEDWTGMLTKAGLTPAGTKTFLADLPAPLTRQARDLVHARFSMAKDQITHRLTEEDRATIATLVDPESPHAILNREDVFFLRGLTIHTGRKP